jgi:MFS family permease
LFVRSAGPARARARRAHYLSAAGLFGILGFHVGVWAVQLAPLSAGLGLDPAALGTALTVAAAAGMVTLFAGGALADRAGRRPVLVIGFAGTGTAFVLLALAGSFAALLPAAMLYGLTISFVDLGGNTVGSAYEQAHATRAMTGLHAWFSAGALAGAIGSAAALRAGMSYRGVYLALAAVMAAGLIAVLLGTPWCSPGAAGPALPRTVPGTHHGPFGKKIFLILKGPWCAGPGTLAARRARPGVSPRSGSMSRIRGPHSSPRRMPVITTSHGYSPSAGPEDRHLQPRQEPR